MLYLFCPKIALLIGVDVKLTFVNCSCNKLDYPLTFVKFGFMTDSKSSMSIVDSQVSKCSLTEQFTNYADDMLQ